MTCEHVTSVLIPYCEIPVSINSIDVMEITRLAESSIIHKVWLIVVIKHVYNRIIVHTQQGVATF